MTAFMHAQTIDKLFGGISYTNLIIKGLGATSVWRIR